MYKPTFSCADDEEQFNEKVLAIELERQVKRNWWWWLSKRCRPRLINGGSNRIKYETT